MRDEKGNLVTNLTQDDFEITEDGVPQKISFFARSTDVPLTLGLIMDVSGSQQSFVKPHHNDLQAFLKTVLQPQDRAFLVCFGNNLRLMSDHSNSAKDLVDALKEFEKGKNVEDFPMHRAARTPRPRHRLLRRHLPLVHADDAERRARPPRPDRLQRRRG